MELLAAMSGTMVLMGRIPVVTGLWVALEPIGPDHLNQAPPTSGGDLGQENAVTDLDGVPVLGPEPLDAPPGRFLIVIECSASVLADQRADDSKILVVLVPPALAKLAFLKRWEDHLIEAVPVGPNYPIARHRCESCTRSEPLGRLELSQVFRIAGGARGDELATVGRRPPLRQQERRPLRHDRDNARRFGYGVAARGQPSLALVARYRMPVLSRKKGR